MNFAEFLKTPFHTQHLRWLLLNYMKELCKYSFENILNQIMRILAYLQKRLISAFIKTQQIKLLSSRLIFNNLSKLAKNLLS